MKLYFTRHGKTEWNQEMRFQGKSGDSPLLPKSYDEISSLGKEVKDVPFSKIYSSSSLRAKKTAEGINQELAEPVEIVYTDDLKELGLGKLEGQLIEEMKQEYGIQLENMRYQLDQYDPSAFSGEPIDQAITRIKKVVLKAMKDDKGPFLFVGHGAALTAAIQHLAGKELHELRDMGGLKNNSLSILEVNSIDDPKEFSLTVWNDDSFLQK